jgi:hypothetical protein
MKQFLRVTFSEGLLSGTAFFLTAAGVLFTIFAPAADILVKALICAVVILLYLSAILGVRSYQFYMTYARRIRVLRQVQGDGLRRGDRYIAIANPGFLRDNVLLSLYSPTSGADQCISILRVEKALPGEDVLARELNFSGESDIAPHFDARNRTELYVNTLIHLNDLVLMIKKTHDETDTALANVDNEVDREG